MADTQSRKQLKDPNAPPRTRSAYLIFCEKNRAEVADNNPDSTMVELSAMLGKMWSETGESARKPFMEASSKSKEQFEKAMEAYKLTEDYAEFQKRKATHNLIAKYVDKIPGAKKKNLYKSFPSDPNQPKRPTTAYFLFAFDNRESMVKKNPDSTYQEVGRLLGEAWKNANDTTKSKYQKQWETAT
eukprot:UN28023